MWYVFGQTTHGLHGIQLPERRRIGAAANCSFAALVNDGQTCDMIRLLMRRYKKWRTGGTDVAQ